MRSGAPLAFPRLNGGSCNVLRMIEEHTMNIQRPSRTPAPAGTGAAAPWHTRRPRRRGFTACAPSPARSRRGFPSSSRWLCTTMHRRPDQGLPHESRRRRAPKSYGGYCPPPGGAETQAAGKEELKTSSDPTMPPVDAAAYARDDPAAGRRLIGAPVRNNDSHGALLMSKGKKILILVLLMIV